MSDARKLFTVRCDGSNAHQLCANEEEREMEEWRNIKNPSRGPYKIKTGERVVENNPILDRVEQLLKTVPAFEQVATPEHDSISNNAAWTESTKD